MVVPRAITAVTVLWLALASVYAFAESPPKTLRCGWYSWDPYQYVTVKDEYKRLTGLDVQLVKEIFGRIGYEVTYDEVSWAQHLRDIKSGDRDIVSGAFKNREREEYAYFSAPFRQETDVLYMRRGEATAYQAEDLEALFRRFKELGFRLGVIEGYYYGPVAMRYIDDPANAPAIVKAPTDLVNVERLLEHRIDGFLADRVAANTLVWRLHSQQLVEQHPLTIFVEDIYVMFSKKTTSPQLVEAFNGALAQSRKSGEYARIVTGYLLPILLSITTGQPWFFVVDIIGTIAFAISGVLLARLGGYDILGACVLAFLPAVGGGLLRDLIVARQPPGVLQSPWYLLAIIITVAAGYVLLRIPSSQTIGKANATRFPRLGWSIDHIAENWVVQAFDAVGLAAFSVIGVIVAVESGASPLWLWGPLLAMITGAGGGIMRDVIRADPNIPSLKGEFYAEVALIWGFLFSLFLSWYASRLYSDPRHIFISVVVILSGAFLTRIGAIYFRIRSPLY